MGLLSKFEGKMEDTVEGAAEKMGAASISPVQIAKKAEKRMRREKMVGAGKQYAPTLYTVLVSPEDDMRLFGYYPTLAGETETYLSAKAAESGLVMDGQPLVRFIADEGLKRGKFDVIAEMVASPLVAKLRQEEMEHYGLAASQGADRGMSGMVPIPGSYQSGYQNQNRRAYDAQQYRNRNRNQTNDESADQAADLQFNDGVDQVGDYDNAYEDSDNGFIENGSEEDFEEQLKGAHAKASPIPEEAEEAEEPEEAEEFEGFEGFEEAEEFGQPDEPEEAEEFEQPAQPAPVMRQNDEVYFYDMTNDRAFTLTGHPMTIGRESKNDIVIPDINVSRVHAEIRLDASGAWILSDLGSTNGTFVNKRQIKSTPLKDADRVTLGTTELEFQIL